MKCVTEAMALRKFGINETYQLAMYLLNQYRGTVLSCRYAIPPRLASAEERAQLEQAFKVAVVDTVMRHPMLQVGMMDTTSKTPSWIQLQSLDLTQHIKWVHIGQHDDLEKTIQETIRIQLDEFFPDLSIKQPGWKFTIVRQENAPIMEVLLTWNHPHFDGAGAKVIQEDILEILNHGENGASEQIGLDGDILRLPQSPPLLPAPLEDLKSLPIDFRFLVNALWEEIRPQFLNWDKSLAAWCPIRSSPPYKTQYRAFFVDKVSTAAILSRCRQNKTTITGLLNGLALIAFSLRLDSASAPAFQSSTIIDHRRNLPPAPPDAPWARSERTVGNYVTQLPHRYGKQVVAQVRSKLPIDASSEADVDLSADLQHELWAASAQNRLEIVHKLEDCLRNDIVGLFKWVTDWKQTMSDMAKRTRQFTWLVTNVGVLNGGNSRVAKQSAGTAATADAVTAMGPSPVGDQSWSIERAQFSLSAEVPAAAIEIAAAGVAGQGMFISANWADGALDTKFGERIMADLERWLAQLASQS